MRITNVVRKGLRWVWMTANADYESCAGEKDGTGNFGSTTKNQVTSALEWLHARAYGNEVEADMQERMRGYAVALIRRDIRKKEHGLAHILPREGQSIEDFAAFKKKLEESLDFKRKAAVFFAGAEL